MIVGTTPFRAETYKNVIENNKNCSIDYNHECINKLSDEGKTLLKSILNPDVDERPTAEDILDDPWI